MNGTATTGNGLGTVDPDQLKARLYSYAPQQAPLNPRALRFNRPTQAQLKKAGVPSAAKLEPLVRIMFAVPK